ncbi:MAG: anthranilate phosphoribosyltransferase, partial [Candidatus Accumulibacter sp.]|nr:anthranilate phosphoribosyltransferase [Accumulibacter sp.]
AGTPLEIVVFNAGAALYAADRVESIGAGIGLARQVIASGAARAKFDEFVRFTQNRTA